MKIHKQRPAILSAWVESEAVAAWKCGGLVPNLVRVCDGLMVTIKNKNSLTDLNENVTCKRCNKLLGEGK